MHISFSVKESAKVEHNMQTDNYATIHFPVMKGINNHVGMFYMKASVTSFFLKRNDHIRWEIIDEINIIGGGIYD